MSRLLVEQDPHGLARLHAAADHRHQLWFDEIFAFSALASLGAVFGGGGGGGGSDGGGGRGYSGGRRRGPARGASTGAGARFPARDGDLGVIDLPVRLIGGTNVALA